jgi:glycosyltransferase involved in cell wall biosynthesis
MTTCSIIITNYNYARYLSAAIESALDQTWPDTEVIVVDDGSTDGSREVIHGFADRIVTVFKDNGGQGSAFNAGVERSGGDVVIFLDADDFLGRDAVETALAAFADEAVVKVHWPLQLIDAEGAVLPGCKPGGALPGGDLRATILETGPTSSLSSPTSGNAWRRTLLEQILPVPEDVAYYRSCADEYLYTLAPVFGRVAAVDRPLGFYRLHATNVYSSKTARQKLVMELDGHGQQCNALAATLARHEIDVDLEQWRRNSWFHRLRRAIDEIEAEVPLGLTFVLADEETWGADGLFGHRTVVSANSLTAVGGPPANDAGAIELLPVLAEFNYVAFGWPSFWWFAAYPQFAEALSVAFETVADTDVARVLKRRSAT